MNLREIVLSLVPTFLRKYTNRIESSPLGYRMFSGAFWSIGGAVISRGTGLMASVFIARILGRDIYGEYGIIRTTVNMFLVFAGFGLGQTATKYVAEYRLTDPTKAGRILAISNIFAMIIGAFVALGIYIYSPFIATNIINAPHLSGELKIGAIILFLNALNGAQTGALAGFEAFKVIAWVNLGSGLISFPILVGGTYFWGLKGAVTAIGVNMLINWLLNHIALRSQTSFYNVPFVLKDCIKEIPIIWRFSIPAVLSGIMVSPVSWLCNTILVNQPGGYGQMGIFDAANQWVTAILFIPGLVGQIVLPILSNLNGLDNQRKFKKILYYNLLLNGGISIVIALPICICSKLIMQSYGVGFEKGNLALVLLSISTILISLDIVIGQAIASRGKMWTGFFLNIVWAVTLLLCSFLLLRMGYGAIGLALANLISYIFHSILVTIYAFNLIKDNSKQY